MWPRSPAAHAHAPDALTLRDVLADAHQDGAHVVLRGVQAVAERQPHLVAAAVALPAGEDDVPGDGGHDGCAVVGGDVHAVVAVVEVLAVVVAAAHDRPGPAAAGVPRRWTGRGVAAPAELLRRSRLG